MKFLKALVLMMTLAVQPLMAADGPMELVKATADKVLHEVTVHKDSLKIDSSGIYTIVNQYILPHFDFNYMTRSAVGRYWSQASVEQQNSLREEFSRLLVKTYGVALLNYSGQDIIYKPMRDSGNEDRAMVETFVAETNGGPKIPVNYRLVKTDAGWKVYDVIIDGVSLVANYRTSFAGEIRRSGLDGLITQLSERNKG